MQHSASLVTAHASPAIKAALKLASPATTMDSGTPTLLNAHTAIPPVTVSLVANQITPDAQLVPTASFSTKLPTLARKGAHRTVSPATSQLVQITFLGSTRITLSALPVRLGTL